MLHYIDREIPQINELIVFVYIHLHAICVNLKSETTQSVGVKCLKTNQMAANYVTKIREGLPIVKIFGYVF